jgi:hypothetical protein
MLLRGFQHQKERGVSLRSIARRLGYKQAAVLSHMAHGRVAVPLERALDIAREVDLNPREFLAAAVSQRTPEAHDLLSGSGFEAFGLANELALIAGGSSSDLSDEQLSVMREVASDPRPRRRWLSVAELQAVTAIREARPDFRERGLSGSDLNIIMALFDIEP